MTKKETLQVLAILKAAYPSSYNGMTREEASGTLGVWYMHFSCVPADIVMMAVQKLIGSHKFPPTVAEVKDALGSIHWEAYETLTSESVRGFLPERAKEQYRRILDALHHLSYHLIRWTQRRTTRTRMVVSRVLRRC